MPSSLTPRITGFRPASSSAGRHLIVPSPQGFASRSIKPNRPKSADATHAEPPEKKVAPQLNQAANANPKKQSSFTHEIALIDCPVFVD